ncbi:hypothetical protein F2P81_018747 [Scophthalmus maximus]|uniref:Uncharacterized protein n=1 Tax=Scophthalmus maximus TaxID=52904 RepID=A0A6A4SGY9_SCOMX|nr:hypothetical protein F2P81_018747 [Scophthalmus maximus]
MINSIVWSSGVAAAAAAAAVVVGVDTRQPKAETEKSAEAGLRLGKGPDKQQWEKRERTETEDNKLRDLSSHLRAVHVQRLDSSQLTQVEAFRKPFWLQQQSWYRSSVTGVIQGMAFTVGGV